MNRPTRSPLELLAIERDDRAADIQQRNHWFADFLLGFLAGVAVTVAVVVASGAVSP